MTELEALKWDRIRTSLANAPGCDRVPGYQEKSTVNHMHILAAILCSALVWLCTANTYAADPPSFKSQLFKKGRLIYSDDFDEKLDRKRWQPRTKTWVIKDGTLTGSPDYKNAEEARKALGRDHHLGLSPVIRLNHLPPKFVLHMRVKFEGNAFATGRPKIDIGHHINTLSFTADGYSLKLHGGERFSGKAPDVRLNEWIDVIVEFQEGMMWIGVNGKGQTIEHEQVSLEGRSELTFKTFAAAPNRIMFDSVRLWKVN